MMKNAHRPVLAALMFINQDISSHILLKQLARQSGTNECTLKKCFRAVLHVSVYQYLLRRRMAKAKYLLENTTAMAKDIAHDCGYQSAAGFITAFRRYYGCTPGETRKQYLNVTVRI
jgi:AraC family transcriptional regulator